MLTAEADLYLGDITYGLDHSTSSRVMRRSAVYGERAEAVLSMFRGLHIDSLKNIVNFEDLETEEGGEEDIDEILIFLVTRGRCYVVNHAILRLK